MARSTPAPRRFAMESLESRQLMAGNINFFVANGDLFITGDNEATGLQIRQVGQNQFILSGTKQGAANTTIQGGSAKIATGVNGNVFINMLGGNDAVTFDDGEGAIATIPGLPSSFQFPRFAKDVQVNMGTGADTLTTDGMRVKGKMTIDMGFGNDADVVELTELETEGFNANGIGLQIDTQGGADRVELLGNELAGLVDIDTGSEDDIVSIVDSLIADADLLIRTQAGNDNVTLDNVEAHLDIEIDAGADQDFVDLEELLVLARLDVDLAGGNDLLRLDDLTAHTAIFDGGLGTDAVIDLDNSTFKTLNEANFEIEF